MNSSVLVQEISSSLYSNFILNSYIVYELNNWPRDPTNNVTLKNCLFGTVKLVRNGIKSKFTYNGWGIPFDWEGSWSFNNDYARNVLIFGVDKSSSSCTDNLKNNVLVLGEGPTQGITDSTGVAERKFSIYFSTGNNYSGDEGYLYVNETEICRFKAKDNISWFNFCLRSISQDFRKVEQSEISLNGDEYNFQLTIIQLKKKTFLIFVNISWLKINMKCLRFLKIYLTDY